MNTGKTLFAQLMDFLPWTTFTRIVDRYGGDHRVRTLSCAEQYRSMAFAQLTYRESLRDIETCLSVHASKLYHMGFRQPVRRSTLADANERRDWRIHAALAQRLITQARTLYVDEELGLDLTSTVYALDSTTIALCLSVFPWAHFRTTKAAVKMHTLLRHACQVEHRCSSRLFGADGSLDRHHLRPDHLPGRLLHPSGLPRTSAAHPLQGPRVRQDAGLHHQQLLASGRHHLRALQKPLAGGTLLQVDQAASSDQAVLRHVGERGEDADLDCRLGLRPRRHRQEVPRPGRLALHFVTDPLGDPLRENALTSSTCGRRKQMQRFANNQPIEFIRFLTGH